MKEQIVVVGATEEIEATSRIINHLPIDGPSCSEMYRSAETSSFARDDVVGRRRGAASGVRGGRTWYARAAAGRNRGDESGVRLAYHVRAPRTSPRGPPCARGREREK